LPDTRELKGLPDEAALTDEEIVQVLPISKTKAWL
jgi:hypothetical protein